MQAFTGFVASLALWVIDDIRDVNRFQCAGTRASSLRIQWIGRSDHWLQNIFAASASTSLTASISLVSASSALNRRIASAATELSSMSRTIVACPSILCEMSSLEIFRAVPFSKARHCALRNLTSLGEVGVDANKSFPRPSRKISDTPISATKRIASKLANPLLPRTIIRFKSRFTRGKRMV